MDGCRATTAVRQGRSRSPVKHHAARAGGIILTALHATEGLESDRRGGHPERGTGARRRPARVMVLTGSAGLYGKSDETPFPISFDPYEDSAPLPASLTSSIPLRTPETESTEL